MKKIAFTLAEVLIVLAIIGIVAAITIPTLINDYQKKQTVTQLKKAYAEFTQTMQLAQVDHGTMETWYIPASKFDNNDLEQARYFGENYIFPYMKIIKKCIPVSDGDCWASDVTNLSGLTANTQYFRNTSDKCISFVTASGYSVYYWLHGVGTGGWWAVDLNGAKKGPNRLGRDIFAFIVNFGGYDGPLGFHFAGLHTNEHVTRDDLMTGNVSEGSTYKCKKSNSTSNDGGYCGAIIFLDGWQISDDYPW